MSTIEERSRRSSIEQLGRISPAYELGYEQGATDQKAIDDAEYRKDMRYVGGKREELIDKCIDAFIELMDTRIVDCAEVCVDKITNERRIRINDCFIRESIKQKII